MIRGFSHIAFNVKNMEETLHFYCDLLGMKQKFTLTCKQAYEQLLEDHQGVIPEEFQDFAAFLKGCGDRKWLTYVEMAPISTLSFFTSMMKKHHCLILPKLTDTSTSAWKWRTSMGW